VFGLQCDVCECGVCESDVSGVQSGVCESDVFVEGSYMCANLMCVSPHAHQTLMCVCVEWSLMCVSLMCVWSLRQMCV